MNGMYTTECGYHLLSLGDAAEAVDHYFGLLRLGPQLPKVVLGAGACHVLGSHQQLSKHFQWKD